MNSEFYTTWFLYWGQADIPKQNLIITKTLNEMNKFNASISFYMIHGGTNFEFWNGAENEGPVSKNKFYIYIKKKYKNSVNNKK